MEDDMESDLKRTANSTREEISELGRHRQIAALAYKFWQARGCPGGTSEEDWFLAEREIAEREAGNAAPETPIAPAQEGDGVALRFPVRSEMAQVPEERTFQKHA